MGAGSGAVAEFYAGVTAAAARTVVDVCDGAIFDVVSRTVQIFRVGSLPVVSIETMSAKLRDV